ncbi:DNA sulfur modification protein DndE [Pseudoduganella sp. FT25W]|uniref:DNA sulfur modification protein DndE n=1 Tax=Duganella alba TaxID=2666081 RepID=A0A6L5QEH8_9BURK|nr:DNA sulfur modification protein DndE [Duganella alba]MRX08137.1 DNA sulfur modification protein DndE [Duganella alba]MRX16326.1 DNA sulfur modification protein DndE [Duganella alba]
MPIDRIRLTASAKNQLIALKRKTNIEHNNALCRHAFCISLANESIPPKEFFNFNGGLEIDWRTFSGGQESLYLNLLALRMLRDGISIDEATLRETLALHLHRGLSYLASRKEDDLLMVLTHELMSADT